MDYFYTEQLSEAQILFQVKCGGDSQLNAVGSGYCTSELRSRFSSEFLAPVKWSDWQKISAAIGCPLKSLVLQVYN